MKNKEQLKQDLFKKILGHMIAVEYCELPESDILEVAMGAVSSFRKIYARPYKFEEKEVQTLTTIIQPKKCYICQTEYQTDKEARECEARGQQEILPVGLIVHIKDGENKKVVSIGTPITMGHENMYFFMNDKGEQESPRKMTIEDVKKDLVYANESNINKICYILRKLGIKPKMVNSDGIIVTL